MPTYIIEHLEPRVWKWCIIEYAHISKIVGKENLWFTNVKNGSKVLAQYGKVIKEPVTKLNLNLACILDPESGTLLSPQDANKFQFYIFGGILGDYPPRKRTKDELTSRFQGIATRNIGKNQFSTDNAVYVTHAILGGTPFEKMKFQDGFELEMGKNESILLPYLYPLVNGKPNISDELVSFLKRKKGF